MNASFSAFKDLETLNITMCFKLAVVIHKTIVIHGEVLRSNFRSDAPEIEIAHWGIPTRPGHSIDLKKSWCSQGYSEPLEHFKFSFNSRCRSPASLSKVVTMTK